MKRPLLTKLPNVFSADEGADVGSDEGTSVSSLYAVPFKFGGKIYKVTIELAAALEADNARKKAALKVGLSN